MHDCLIASHPSRPRLHLPPLERHQSTHLSWAAGGDVLLAGGGDHRTLWRQAVHPVHPTLGWVAM